MNKSLVEFFDSLWYLEKYPDVANSKVDPLTHFIQFGFSEGRLPFRILSFELDDYLWAMPSDKQDSIFKELKQLFESGNSIEIACSAWVITRFLSSKGMWSEALEYAGRILTDDLIIHILGIDSCYLLIFSVYYHNALLDECHSLINHSYWTSSPNKVLAESMLLEGIDKLSCINSLLKEENLSSLNINSEPVLDGIVSSVKVDSHKLDPLVSIIIPCYNAGKTIATALRSLLKQSYQRIEILVSDDCSTDNSRSVVQEFCSRDSRVKLLRLPKNRGAYVARNHALSIAKGSLITTHDADDWSHPQKIRLQVDALKWHPKIKASVSHWVRTTPEMTFQRWRMEEGWIYRNVSSLMFRRSVFKKLGYWDLVSVNADTEYYHRIRRVFGDKSIVEVKPGVPLSFGRADDASLSQTKATHLRTQFRGVRKDYHDAAIRWHSSTKKLYLKQDPEARPFPVPSLIFRGSPTARKSNIALKLKASSLFDGQWYLDRYQDIRSAKTDPFAHFIKFGLEEGRDPSPYCSVSGLALKLSSDNFTALEHYLENTEESSGPVSLPGQQLHDSDKNTIVAVGHQATNELFGAERSFLDALNLLHTLDFNLVVVLPHANAAYIEAVSSMACKIVIMPYGWWDKQTEVATPTVNAFKQVLSEYRDAHLYVNTLVLREPVIAGNELGMTTTIHVRELLEYDNALCKILNASHVEVSRWLKQRSCAFIANSKIVAEWIPAKTESVSVIPNFIYSDSMSLSAMPKEGKLTVVVLSSNLPKKGIEDVIQVAKYCNTTGSDIVFKLYGPANSFVTNWQKQGLPANLTFCGYANSATNVIQNAHIVLNLSHFKESFGRTVLEAMAASRAVVAYRWGALPELIDETCGVLVDFGDTQKVADTLFELSHNRTKLQYMGECGYQKACRFYTDNVVREHYLKHFKKNSS